MVYSLLLLYLSRLRNAISCEKTLEEVLDDVNSLVVELALSPFENLWVKDLETARNSLKNAIELHNTIALYPVFDQIIQNQIQTEKDQKIELTINLITHVLSTTPPIINTKLNIVARSLRLLSLVKKMEFIRHKFGNSELALEKINHLQSRIDSLNQLNGELTFRIQKHDEWQLIDSKSRLIEVTTVQEFFNLEISWPSLKVMSEIQYNSLSEQWAIDFRRDCENLESAILTKNKVAAKHFFNQFRRKVSYRFYKVDKDLKALCTNLQMVSDSLALALRMML